MLECLILGDSIAVGTAKARPECFTVAHGGINSSNWNKDYLSLDLNAKTVIISLGTNDHKGVHTYDELVKLRKKVEAGRVFWILPPIKPDIQDIVRNVAKEYNDQVITISQDKLSNDKIHPTPKGYKELGDQTR